MRYQVIVPSDEFSEAMTINAVSWAPFEGLGDNVNFNAFTIDMGLCAADVLDPVFDTNYISGTKTRVLRGLPVFRKRCIPMDDDHPGHTVLLRSIRG